LDRILVTGLRAYGYHGVLAHERRDGQEFGVDLVLHIDTRPAAANDDLAATIDYGALATRIADDVRGEPVDLLETLAARIAATCLQDERVRAVDVTVHKPSAPVRETVADIAVSIHRRRDEA
jgi:dihydroneopterin aldolase